MKESRNKRVFKFADLTVKALVPRNGEIVLEVMILSSALHFEFQIVDSVRDV